MVDTCCGRLLWSVSAALVHLFCHVLFSCLSPVHSVGWSTVSGIRSVRGAGMRVQRLVMPDESGSWTVLDDRGEVIAPVEAFLAHLQALNRSPETVRT